MTTVEAVKKAETFEPALESARKLNFPLKDFLRAFPEFANPVSQTRLREILKDATKDSLPQLWEIYSGFVCLELVKEYHCTNFYQVKKSAIEWRVSEIVAEELQLRPPQNVADTKFLRDMSPEHSNERRLAEDLFVYQLRSLIDEKKTLEQLVEDRKLFPEKYPIRNDLDALICKKANKRLSGKLTPTERFECIELVGDILPYLDKVKGLESLVSQKVSIDVLLRATEMLIIKDNFSLESSTIGFEGSKLRGRMWAIIIGKTNNRELWWKAARFGTNNWVWDDTCMSARLKILKTSPSLQELLEMFLETGSIVHDYKGLEYHGEVLNLLVSQFKSALSSATVEEESEIRVAYDTVANKDFRVRREDKDCWWQAAIRSLLMRRLYELSQSK